MTPIYRTAEELEAGLPGILASPKDAGTLDLIVRRPSSGEREELAEAMLDRAEGLVGDNWRTRGGLSTPPRVANPEMQINVMNARCIALLAGSVERRALAGDQLYVDLDLSAENLPVGTQLALGEAILEVTAPPHLGCGKFVERFGRDARDFVNSPRGRELRLRGLNAKIVRPGAIRRGDVVRKISA